MTNLVGFSECYQSFPSDVRVKPHASLHLKTSHALLEVSKTFEKYKWYFGEQDYFLKFYFSFNNE